jgi:hypothetical protein
LHEDFDILNPYFNDISKNSGSGYASIPQQIKLPLSYIEKKYVQIDTDYTLGNINSSKVANITNDNNIDVFENRIELKDNLKKNIDETIFPLPKSKVCTLVSIINTNNGEYEYKYQKYYDNDCDINKFELNDNNQLFFSDISGNIGSCRHYYQECINFTTPENCPAKILYWSPKTCYDKISFPVI